jgi:hypothetical protein
VVEAERLGLVKRLELVHEVERLLRDVLLGPGGGDGGVHRELGDVQLVEHDQVVIPDQHEIARLLGERHAFVRLSAVSDEVAEAPDRIHALLLDVRQDGLEGGQVAVYVGQDRDAQRGHGDAL